MERKNNIEEETDGNSDSSDNLGSLNKIIKNPSSCIIKNHSDDKTVKMVFVHPDGEQHLYTFSIPDENCTVQDLINQVTLPSHESMRIHQTKKSIMKYDYVVELNPRSEEFSGKRDERLVDVSSDREDQGSEQSTKPDLKSSSIPSTSRNTQNETEMEIITEKEPVVFNDNAVPSIVEPDVGCQKNVDGEATLPEDPNMIYDFHVRSPYTHLVCRVIMIGSHAYVPEETALVSASGLCLKAPLVDDGTKFVPLRLKFKDIVYTGTYFGEELPVVIFYTRWNAGDKIRKLLGMRDREGPYFYPLSQNDKQKTITLLLDYVTKESEMVLKTLFQADNGMGEYESDKVASLVLWLSPENILPLVESIIEELKTRKLTVDDTVNYEIETVVEKQQVSTNRSNKITPTVEDVSVSEEIKTVVPRSKNLLKRSKPPATAVVNPRNGDVPILLIYPPPPAKGGITITSRDYACLDENNFLNDVIIDFYLEYLTRQVLSKEDQDRTHIFSIHFYKRLTSSGLLPVDDDALLSSAQKRHAQVQKWTKNRNIFEKDFIIVPINENAHWYLAIVCFPGLVGKMQASPTALESRGVKQTIYKRRKAKEMKLDAVVASNQRELKKLPCILIFDSLAGPDRTCRSVTATLRDYLSCEYVAKFGRKITFSEETMKGGCPRVPQQTNYCDCGLYVLQYVESFFSNPIKDYTLPIETLQNWFDDINIIRKRKQLTKLIKGLIKSWSLGVYQF